MYEKKNISNSLPLGYTAREAIDYVESKVNDIASKREAFISILTSITTRVYNTTPDGPVHYLKAMATDKRRCDILQMDYKWATIIANCQHAIRHSGVDKSKTREIEQKWLLEDVNKPVDTVFMRFSDFYIRELHLLEIDGPDGTSDGAANAAVLAKIEEVETNIQTLNDN